MKSTLFLFCALTFLTLQSCQQGEKSTSDSDDKDNRAEVNTQQETPVKMIESLVGEWTLAGGGSATNNQSGNGDQKLTFTEEARYIIRKGNAMTDSGAYRMNEQLNNLYLESEANEKAREYEVKIQGDTLMLSSKEGSQQGGSGEQIYVRN